jgi:N-acetylglucosaminyldiphosphoundecaprenol N-acetyl-beta-D-mannosaminyltransferase
VTRVAVLGVPFDAVTLPQAVQRAAGWLDGETPRFVVTPNPEIVQLTRRDPEAKAAVLAADLILPDGIGIVKAARILGRPLPGRVPGFDFGMALLEALEGTPHSVFLLGAKPGVAETARDKLLEKLPRLRVAGTMDGYFRDDADAARAVADSGADVLFCCLGAPKQELFSRRYADKLPRVKLHVGLGGSLDAMAGAVRRAPRLWQNLGLEWLYRMLRQPSRFKRFGALPRFMLDVYRQKRQEKRGHDR